MILLYFDLSFVVLLLLSSVNAQTYKMDTTADIGNATIETTEAPFEKPYTIPLGLLGFNGGGPPFQVICVNF